MAWDIYIYTHARIFQILPHGPWNLRTLFLCILLESRKDFWDTKDATSSSLAAEKNGIYSCYIICKYKCIIKGSLDEKLPSYEVLKMLRE